MARLFVARTLRVGRRQGAERRRAHGVAGVPQRRPPDRRRRHRAEGCGLARAELEGRRRVHRRMAGPHRRPDGRNAAPCGSRARAGAGRLAACANARRRYLGSRTGLGPALEGWCASDPGGERRHRVLGCGGSSSFACFYPSSLAPSLPSFLPSFFVFFSISCFHEPFVRASRRPSPRPAQAHADAPARGQHQQLSAPVERDQHADGIRSDTRHADAGHRGADAARDHAGQGDRRQEAGAGVDSSGRHRHPGRHAERGARRPGRPHRAVPRSQDADRGGVLLQDAGRHGRTRLHRGGSDARHRQFGSRGSGAVEGIESEVDQVRVPPDLPGRREDVFGSASGRADLYGGGRSRIERPRLHPSGTRRCWRPDLWDEIRLAPRLAHFVSLSTPYRGQPQRPGGAGSAGFAG
ncbi:hypothetical protein VARIO8X_90001 [Burkholderiales bacterium 8X]|nr:hypothetical protein VARIO8X_90001 [Burkholderiales bacterium 8X]